MLRRTFSVMDVVLLAGVIAFAIGFGLLGWGQAWLAAAVQRIL